MNWYSLLRCFACLAIFVATAGIASALTPLGSGAFHLDNVDELLQLKDNREVRLVVIELAPKKKLISDAHIQGLRAWVESGGVIWVTEKGLQSPLVRLIAPFRVEKFDYTKSATGKSGGELVARGVSSRLVIWEHPLTTGVDKLFLFPRYSFAGTVNARPLVEMTDTKGHHGVVMSTLKLGQGLIVLDGTARKKKSMSWLPGIGNPGFDPGQPNAIQQSGEWNSYDWSRLMENAIAHATAAMTGAPMGGGR